MYRFRIAVAVLAVVVGAGSWVAAGAGQQPSAQPFTSAPPPAGAEGLQVFPAVEGWGPLDRKSTRLNSSHRT